MTERIAYNEYAKLKYNTIKTMKICPSVQDSTRPHVTRKHYGSMFYRPGGIADGSFTLLE